ncbi:MAG: UDP-2,3-diacylglucosamine diphosphatase [Halioglobus sp.]|nr:UDP-2,3-diacylglucosamine diphosphatase [Halioglobus sp.]
MPAAPVTWFIADLHLDPARPRSGRDFATFLQRLGDGHALYILGDLFEAWPGDDDDCALAESTRSELAAFTARGGQLCLLHGNRDFLLGAAFCRATGARLLADPTLLDLHGTPTLLMHGDSLCTADRDYQAFRRRARSAHWQAQILARDLQQRRALAADLRRISHEAQGNKAADIVDVTPAEVERVMAQHGAAQLIHGHTHRPGRHEHAAGTRWVLGDWESGPLGLKVTSEESVLVNPLNI